MISLFLYNKTIIFISFSIFQNIFGCVYLFFYKMLLYFSCSQSEHDRIWRPGPWRCGCGGEFRRCNSIFLCILFTLPSSRDGPHRHVFQFDAGRSHSQSSRLWSPSWLCSIIILVYLKSPRLPPLLFYPFSSSAPSLLLSCFATYCCNIKPHTYIQLLAQKKQNPLKSSSFIIIIKFKDTSNIIYTYGRSERDKIYIRIRMR